ncbi:MAG: polysaccharide biosynthesis protein [Ignavibacteriaceae bacterium]|nr:polysaccharide biosynthesis protein [Ignavibacteriaceae bacterium]
MRKLTFIFFDIIAFSISLILAFQIRFEFNALINFNYDLVSFLLVFVLVKLIVFYSFKLYDISWRYVSLQDLANIGKAILLSNGILFIIIYGFNLNLFVGFPRSILLIDLIFSFVLSSGFKISKRMYLEVMRQSIGISDLKRTLIIGAGSSGEQILRDINRSETRKFYPIGFIDDDPLKQNLYLQGIRVLGTTKNLAEIIKRYQVDSILISVLTADRKFHRKILSLAREAGITDVKVISTINDISDSVKVRMQDVRDIDVSDLIGRQAVAINTKVIGNYLNNKRVMITGAAGSIGSEISRQVVYYEPEEIAIVDINESDLADLELQLKTIPKSTIIKMYLCDISDQNKVNKMFESFRPDVIFHAAAYKHVPVMEKFPEEAVRVNIIGTYNMAAAVKKFNVSNFVLISTDKAVNPTSIMGVSKRIAEQIVTGMASDSTFVAVRFGNVIGSRGSALPIFLTQLKNGGPITVTHPDMKRYFMTIPEAVALVLQAAATGKNGDVFILDMGEPIRIIDLVEDLITLHNLVPNKDIKIEYTGIRDGEKLVEEVLTAEEGVIPTSHEKIFKAKMISLHNQQTIDNMVDEFRSLNGHTSKEDWKVLFKYYVPTYNPSVHKNGQIDEFGDSVFILPQKNKEVDSK